MHVSRSALLSLVLLFSSAVVRSQVLFCPENSGFEYGNFTNWLLYTGTCCPINTPTLSGPVPMRHEITSGGGVDPYGFFPIVAPGSGTYSMKLGNNGVGAQAEKAKYYVHVPSGINNYSLIYRYAVVFEDPGHLPNEQPRFEVKAYDSATNVILPCASFLYISSSSLPGFQTSTVDPGVKFKDWTTATLNLSGFGGQTVAVEFATGDCLLTAHFGYGYVDMSCGLFQVSGATCGSPYTTLTAPPGFQYYTWYDSTYSNIVGNGQVITIPTPPVTTTYHVILTPFSGFGCPDTLTTTVYISNLQLTASPDTTVCAGTTVNLYANATGNMGPFSYNWTPSTGLSCTNCQNPTTTVNGNMTYYVTVTDSNGCTKTDTVNLNVAPPFTLATSSQNAPCTYIPNGTATVIVNGPGTYTYSWSTNPVQTTSTATNLSPGTYTVTVTNSYGCPQTAIVAVGVNPPFAVSTSVQNVSCNGGSNGSASVTAAGGPFTYSWSTNPVQTTQTATNLPAGTYTVTITNNLGCPQTATVTITQPPPISVNILTTPTLCNGSSSGSANLFASGGTAPYTVVWNTNPVQTGNTANNLPAGTVTATVTDAHGCTATGTGVVGQPAVLNAYISYTNSPQCINIPGVATVAATGGTGPYTYSWNTNPVQTTQTVNNLQNGTYIVTVTDAHGCVDTAMVTIYQSPNLLLTTASTPVSCNGLANGTAAVTGSSGTPPYTYLWNNSQTSSSISNLGPGTYTVTVTDANNCDAIATVTVTEPPALNATATHTDIQCHGEQTGSGSVTVTGGTPQYSYLWNTGGTIANPSGMGAGNYTVVITDANGCTDSASIQIAEPPELLLSATAQSGTCIDQSGGSAQATVTGGTSPYNVQWSSSPPQTGMNAQGLMPGTYNVTVTDANGCSKTSSITINGYPLPNLSAGPDQVYCYGVDTIILAATGAVSYTWAPAQHLSCSNCATTIANPNITTTFLVVGIDSNGCSDSDEVMVTVFTDEPASAGNDLEICIGDTVKLYATGGGTYTWYPVTGPENQSADPNVSPNTTTTYTVAINKNICFSDTFKQTVTVHEYPTVTLGPDMNVLPNTSVQLHADTTKAESIAWDPVTGLSCGDCTDPVAYVEGQITYTATVYNGTCKAQDDITIYVSCDVDHIFMANSFTPNNDGVNELFYPQTPGMSLIKVFRVYNRWGQLLHEVQNFYSNDPKYGWNGTFNGDHLSPDVYVYYLETICPDGKRVFKKGDISLLR